MKKQIVIKLPVEITNVEDSEMLKELVYSFLIELIEDNSLEFTIE